MVPTDAAQLIPDQPLTEFVPVTWSENGSLRRFLMVVNFGRRQYVRKAWVDQMAPEEGLLVVSQWVETFHCEKDCEIMWKMGVRPLPGMYPEFEAAPIEVSGIRSDVAVLRWTRHGLDFEQHVYVFGNVIGGVLAVSRGSSGASAVLQRTVEETRSRTIEASPGRTWPCWQLLGRSSWILVVVAAVALAVGLAHVLGGPESLFGVGAVGLVVFVLFVLDPRHVRQLARSRWAAAIEQGDADGTIRRALASIGIELPEALPPTA